jgi:hypothetical protein
LCLYRVVFGITAKESRPASVELMSRCWRSDSRLPNVSVLGPDDQSRSAALDGCRRSDRIDFTSGYNREAESTGDFDHSDCLRDWRRPRGVRPRGQPQSAWRQHHGHHADRQRDSGETAGAPARTGSHSRHHRSTCKSK